VEIVNTQLTSKIRLVTLRICLSRYWTRSSTVMSV